MKAVALSAPGTAEVIDVPEPTHSKDNVLLKVELVGLCGTDLNSFRGRNPMVTFPRIIGHEIAGTVLEGAGDIVKGQCVTVSPYTNCGICAACRRGRANACEFNQTFGVQRDGAMTGLLSIPPEKLFPSSLSMRELCLVEPLTVGMHSVARGDVKPGETVLVYGCGGVGLGAVAGAAFRGANVVAVDVDDDKLAVAHAAGAAHRLNSVREPVRERVLELTEGRGPDVIIEAVGLSETFRAAVEQVAFTGRVVYIGYAKEPVAYETKLFVQKELDIRGSRNALPSDFREVIRLLESGRFPSEQAISAVVPIEEAPGMLLEWSNHPARYTKIMVEI